MSVAAAIALGSNARRRQRTKMADLPCWVDEEAARRAYAEEVVKCNQYLETEIRGLADYAGGKRFRPTMQMKDSFYRIKLAKTLRELPRSIAIPDASHGGAQSVRIGHDFILLQTDDFQTVSIQQSCLDRANCGKKQNPMAPLGERLCTTKSDFARAAVDIREVIEDHDIHTLILTLKPGPCIRMVGILLLPYLQIEESTGTTGRMIYR